MSKIKTIQSHDESLDVDFSDKSNIVPPSDTIIDLVNVSYPCLFTLRLCFPTSMVNSYSPFESVAADLRFSQIQYDTMY
jgi:hypothetical protein